ncbi:MAG: hypothetical protein E7058_02645 [Lentisphaerae bacterium]|nr:hypothetical protein [Lentisphaerota bacterium]
MFTTTQFGEARWLWLQESERNEVDRRVRFRKTFELETVPETFPAMISADAKYKLYVNGRFVHFGPARDFTPGWTFDRIDLAAYLKPGKNLIAILGYQFGRSNYMYSYSHQSAVIFKAPGLISDESWMISEDPGYIRNVSKGSVQYAFQEFFDCSKSDDSWLEIDYDDSGWQNFRGWIAGAMPWNHFEERGIPLLEERIIKDAEIIAASDSEVDPQWREIRSVIIPYHQEKPVYRTPETVANPTSVIYDFGREVVGMLQFRFEADDAMDFLVFEKLDGMTPRICPDGELHTAYGGRLYPASGKVCEHELTLPWGFRYLIVFNRGKGKFKCSVSVRECRYAIEEKGTFNISDPRLQQIRDMCVHTQRCCIADSYIDCPSREYAQWWGDALVQSQNTFRLDDDPALLRRGLRTMARQTTPEGLTYGVAPGCAHNCVLPDYSAMYLVTLHAEYMQTGSPELWRELRSTASGIISYFEKYITPADGVPFDQRYWLFVDWCPTLDKIETYNMIILWGVRMAAALAEISGEPADIALLARCRELEAKLRKGIKLQDPPPHAAAMAIILDLKPECHRQYLDEILLPMMKNAHDHPVQPGPYFMYYVFEAVKKYGHSAEIIDCIRRWWGEFADAGLSTVAEHFIERNFHYVSMCHAWSAHPMKFFSELMLGIRQIAPRWDEVAFEPYVEPGMVISGTVPTPHGIIEVNLDYSGSELKKSLILPPGVKLAASNG